MGWKKKRPGEEGPPFPDSNRFGSLDFRLLQGLGMRDVGVVCTTLDAKD